MQLADSPHDFIFGGAWEAGADGYAGRRYYRFRAGFCEEEITLARSGWLRVVRKYGLLDSLGVDRDSSDAPDGNCNPKCAHTRTCKKNYGREKPCF